LAATVRSLWTRISARELGSGRFDGLLRGKQIAPRQTFAGYQTGPGEGSVADAMSEPLRLTIVYEDDGDGWVVARRSGVQSSRGQPAEEARESVIDALRELLAARFGSAPELPGRTGSDSLELTIAA
jgi:hypothetical protein